MLSLLALLIALVSARDVTAQTRYTVTRLKFANNDDTFGATAYAINDAGQVAGRAGWRQPFRYSNGVMTSLGSAYSSVANPFTGGLGINRWGQVVGNDGDGYQYGFLWTPGGTSGSPQNPQMKELRGLAFSARSTAYGINDSGRITGSAETDWNSGVYHAYIDDGTTVRDLGSLGGGESHGYAINNVGQVTGGSYLTPYNDYRAFRYSGNTMTNIGALLGPHYSSWGNAINSNGDVAGLMTTSSGSFNNVFPFLYRNGLMSRLNFGGEASGINDIGDVVGKGRPESGPEYAFLYRNGNARDLNTLLNDAAGWNLIHAYDINNVGQIVGHGTFAGQDAAFLLTPVVPVPAGLAVIAALGIALPRRRRIG